MSEVILKKRILLCILKFNISKRQSKLLVQHPLNVPNTAQANPLKDFARLFLWWET